VLSLDGKVALVTGCSSIGAGWGNGKATAVLLARQGASVFGRRASSSGTSRWTWGAATGRALWTRSPPLRRYSPNRPARRRGTAQSTNARTLAESRRACG